MILQVATALAIGAYVVLSKDAQSKRPDATPHESVTKTTGDRSKSVTALGANSHHSTPTPPSTWRVTRAITLTALCPVSGGLIVISIYACRRNAWSVVTKAPLRLRSFKRP
jgi:hypothetical protein